MPSRGSIAQVRADPTARDPRRRPVGQLLVLLGLTGFAITQPMLDLLGRNPTVFTFNDVDGWALVWLALGLALIPALGLWLAGLGLTAIDERVGYGFHLVCLGALASLTVVQILKWVIDLRQPMVVALLSLAAGAGFAYAYARYRPVGQWARFTAVLPAIAVVLFLFGSASGDLLRGPQSTAVAATDGQELPPVVFIMLDEFPTKTLLDDNDEIDPIRFPNLDEFADDATWYRHFTTLAPFSNQAIPSILTGKEPEIVEPLWTEHPDNLFSLLAPTHNLSVFESFTKLCGSEKCVEGPPGAAPSSSPQYGDLADTVADLWIDQVSPANDTERVLDDFDEASSIVEAPSDALPLFPTAEDLQIRPGRHQEFLDALQPTDDPSLYFLHLVLPHAPFRFYPNGDIYDTVFQAGSYPSSQENDVGSWGSSIAQQRHIWQTRYTDALVGEAMDELKEIGIYDEALIVVMADHGASFRLDTPFRWVTPESLDAIAYAPLLIKAPQQTEGVIDDANMMGIDVLPTIADIMGIEVPWEVDGYAAGSPEIEERGPDKYIYDLAGSMGSEISLVGILDFDDREKFPRASDRWVAPARPNGYPMSGLLDSLGVADYIGRSVAEVASDDSPSGQVNVAQLKKIRRPGETRAGWIQGTVEDVPDDAVVMVEVNGSIVSASPLVERDGKQEFVALLPMGVLGDRNEIRVAWLADGTVTEAVVN